MKNLFICLVLMSSLNAHASGTALGPPPSSDDAEVTSDAPLDQSITDCIINVIENDGDPVTECDL